MNIINKLTSNFRLIPFLILLLLLVPFDNTPKVIYVILAFAFAFVLSITKVFNLQTMKGIPSSLWFVIFAGLSLIWVESSFAFSATRFQSCALMYLLLLLTIKYCGDSSDTIHACLLAILAGTVVLMILEFGNITSGLTTLLTESDRLETEALNSNAMGKYFAIGSMICLYFGFFKKNYLFFIVYFALAFCILMLKSKSATLSLVFGSAIFSYIYCRNINKKMYFYIGLGLVIAGFMYLENRGLWGDTFIRMNRMFDFFLKGDTSDQSTADRAYLAEKSFELFLQRPIFGWGIGSANSLLGSYSHNNYAQLLMETGVIGFSLFYYVIIKTMYFLYKLRSNPLCLLLLAIFVIFLLSDINNTTYYHKIYYVIIGLGICLVKQNNNYYGA